MTKGEPIERQRATLDMVAASKVAMVASVRQRNGTAAPASIVVRPRPLQAVSVDRLATTRLSSAPRPATPFSRCNTA